MFGHLFDRLFFEQVTDDGKYLILNISESCDPSNKIYYFELENIQKDKDGKWIPHKLIDTFDGMFDFLTNNGSTFFFHSNKNAPQYKIITIDCKEIPVKSEKIIIPEKNKNMPDVVCAGNRFVVKYMKDVQESLEIYEMDGTYVRDLDQPGFGSLSVSGKRDQTELFYSYSGFTNPGRIYHYDFQKDKSEIFREIKINGTPCFFFD